MNNKQTVLKIPATCRERLLRTDAARQERTNLRVAAYCRVSTGEESQRHSYELQVRHYTDLIQNHEGWSLCGVYADEGQSGTTMKKRAQFSRMMEAAKKGEIDYILTKSISRFARNTLDTLHCIRMLQQLKQPVGIFFEKENLDTLDVQSEFVLTILSAIAQEESRSISDNVRWGIQKRFMKGEVSLNLNRQIGYERGEQGEWRIQEEQADTVRYIFQRFLEGAAVTGIARELTSAGRRTATGNTTWYYSSVMDILNNEKMVGDLRMQKTYTESFLTHKSRKNTGQMPSYYVRDHHEGIIAREIWDAAQERLLARRKRRESQTGEPLGADGAYPFSGKLICQCCQERLISRCYVYRKKSESGGGHRSIRYHVWRCRTAVGRSRERTCHCASYLNVALEQGFMELLYQIRREYEKEGMRAGVLQNMLAHACREPKKEDYLQNEKLRALDREVNELTDMLCDVEELKGYIGDSEYASLQREAQSQMRDVLNMRAQIQKEMNIRTVVAEQIDWFLQELTALPDVCGQQDSSLLYPFSELLFKRLVKNGTVMKNGTVVLETTLGVPMVISSAASGRKLRDFVGCRYRQQDGRWGVVRDTGEVEHICRHIH